MNVKRNGNAARRESESEVPAGLGEVRFVKMNELPKEFVKKTKLTPFRYASLKATRNAGGGFVMMVNANYVRVLAHVDGGLLWWKKTIDPYPWVRARGWKEGVRNARAGDGRAQARRTLEAVLIAQGVSAQVAAGLGFKPSNQRLVF